MTFSCTAAADNSKVVDHDALEQTHSAFGDGYSVKSRSTSGSNTYGPAQQRQTTMRYNHDEPEADYDDGATDLYRRIENKDWDGALSRLEVAPIEAKTWVSRREQNSNKTRWRLLPLHAVCIFRAPLALIEALIEVYADGPKMKDDQGMLPVHLACRNGASKGVVTTLLSAFPESINVRDRKGRTPKDLVEASSSANKEAVLSAINRFKRGVVTTTPTPESYPKRGGGGGEVAPPPPSSSNNTQQATTSVVHEVDYEHRTILFRLIIKKDWKAAANRASNYSDEASTWIVTKGFNGNLRFLPLHKACVLKPPEFMIESLLRAYPNGAKSKDQDGWLPLHCACFYGASDKVIYALLDAYPKGAQSKDDEGRLPLHYACLKGSSQGVVDALLKSMPKGAMSKDDEGRLPIHHACGKGAPEGVIDALLKASPKGAQSKDDQGRLPLHHACRKNASERVIRTLLRVYPRAAQIKDDQEKLPIHYCCQNGATPSVVSLVLATYPESVNVKNGFGMTPLAEAKATENPKMDPVIKLLERAKKDQDKINKATASENASTEAKVAILEDRVTQLERSLAKISSLGREMRHDLVRRNKDPADVLEKFSDKLIDIGKRSRSRSKTPLKSRQATPSKGGFFGLGSKSNPKVKSK